MTTELNSFVQANEALRLQLDRKARVHEIRAMNEEKIMMSTHNVHRSRSPIRSHVVEGPPPVVGLQRVPVFEDHVVERSVPVLDRVERTYETIPVGHRIAERSRSPLLQTSTSYVGGYHEAARFSAATPTVSKTVEEK